MICAIKRIGTVAKKESADINIGHSLIVALTVFAAIVIGAQIAARPGKKNDANNFRSPLSLTSSIEKDYPDKIIIHNFRAPYKEFVSKKYQ